MATDRPSGSTDGMEEFSKDMEAHHLAQILAAKYEKDPDLLGRHYEMNFTALPAQDAHGEDPARASKVMLASWKPKYSIPQFGNILIPENVKGNDRLSILTRNRAFFKILIEKRPKNSYFSTKTRLV